MRNFPDQFTEERKLEVEALLEHCLHGLGVQMQHLLRNSCRIELITEE